MKYSLLKLIFFTGFVVRSIVAPSGAILIAGEGNLPDAQYQTLPNMNTARLYSMYSILETLGYAFFHPNRPTIPTTLVIQTPFNITERPRWPVRGWHYHTEHPLELTNFFNGWGLNGTDDEASFNQMLNEDWPMFLEWLVANRQNSLEVVLLRALSWDTFAYSSARQKRYQAITQMSAQWGIALGADVAIAGTLSMELNRISVSMIDFLSPFV